MQQSGQWICLKKADLKILSHNLYFTVIEESLSLPVNYSDLEGILIPDAVVTVYLKGTVKETKRSYAHVESFKLTKPSLDVKVVSTLYRR